MEASSPEPPTLGDTRGTFEFKSDHFPPRWRWRETLEIQLRISIREIGSVSVEPRPDYRTRNGTPEEPTKPDISVLVVKTLPGKSTVEHRRAIIDGKAKETDDRITEFGVMLVDQEFATRLAKAIVHAVELCGGGDKDPFK